MAAVEYSIGEVERLFRTNQLAAFELSRALHPLLAAAATGRVVNVASVSGLASTGTGTPYAMTKAALIQMTKSLAAEWAGDGILVNAVAPWYIRTLLVEDLLADSAKLARILARRRAGSCSRLDSGPRASTRGCPPRARPPSSRARPRGAPLRGGSSARPRWAPCSTRSRRTAAGAARPT
jgi:Tropinone reductase 1